MKSNAKPVRLSNGLQKIMLAYIFPNAVKQFQMQNIFENIHSDPGKPQKYTNGKPADIQPLFVPKKDSGMPTAAPVEHPELKNLSTEKPVFQQAEFMSVKQHERICHGVVYYARDGYNRYAIGTPKQFVAVMSAATWAIYVGNMLQSIEVIEAEGEKVTNSKHVEQLVVCSETIQYYRF